MKFDNILYIDTESENFKCYSIQCYFKNKIYIFFPLEEKHYREIKKMWSEASAICLFNAPYDLGVLSYAFKENKAEWKANEVYGEESNSFMWNMKLFGFEYKVRRLNTKFNYIRNFKKNKSPPIIDLLKLWSIFIDDGRVNKIGLKDLLERELNIKVIRWEDRNTNLNNYLKQDVVHLPDLLKLFFKKVKPINDIKDFTLQDWANVKTNASITKHLYTKIYPQLKEYKKENDEIDKNFKLNTALEDAYMGGLTLALYRGNIENKTVWYDIKSSYASVIVNMNLDRYLNYSFQKIEYNKNLINRDEPYLCKLESNIVLRKIEGGLKIFKLKIPIKNLWLWSFDILSLKLLFKDANLKILEVYKPIPLLNVNKSLPSVWNELKNKQIKGSVLYDFYKLLSNTAYGIKAQRKPFKTIHTNLVIGGIITSRARLTLCELIDEAKKHNQEWIYSDTDSICLRYKEYKDITDNLNNRIAPYKIECEGYDYTTIILSLKRYITYNGSKGNKIKLHGKGLTDISQQNLYDYIVLKKPLPNMNVSLYQLSANTERSRLILSNKLKLHFNSIPPFAFVKNIKTDLTYKKWFKDWYYHIDKKLSYPDTVNITNEGEKEFKREFLTFLSIDYANNFYNSSIKDIDIDDNVGAWNEDELIDYYFNLEKEYHKLNKYWNAEKQINNDTHDDYYDGIYDSSLTKNENKRLYKDNWKQKMGLYQ